MTSYTFPAFDPTPLYLGGFQAYTREVTIASGANASGSVLPRGTVLGVVTSSGNYITSATAASDGSQTPRCILAVDIDASAAAVANVPAYFTGDFADLKCVFGTGHTAITVNNAFAASGQPIFIRQVGTAS